MIFDLEKKEQSFGQRRVFFGLAPNQKGRPVEDAFPLVCSLPPYLFLVVADGVTRWKDERGIYPSPSPAQIAAERALRRASDFFRQITSSERGISRNFWSYLFWMVNGEIKELNQSLGLISQVVDYGYFDYAATTFTGALLELRDREECLLSWGHIGDSALWTLTREGGMRRLTRIQTVQKDFWAMERKVWEGDFYDHQEWSRFHRAYLRNQHPRRTFWGREVDAGYGALTGEEEARDFWEIGEIRLSPQEEVLILTDGASFVGEERIRRILGEREEGKDFLHRIFFQARDLGGKDDMSGILLI